LASIEQRIELPRIHLAVPIESLAMPKELFEIG
jgi:hypothetical protein